MQKTSDTYKRLAENKLCGKEWKLEIAGVTYGQEKIADTPRIFGGLFAQDTLCVGSACAQEMEFTLREYGEIPKGAEVRPYFRLREENTVSEWIPKGVFLISRRQPDDVAGTLQIHCFDLMLKSERVWEPDQSLVFPMTFRAAVLEMARLMGVEVENPEDIDAGDTMVDYPANEYTRRNVLQFCAGANGGNFTMTDEGKLRLVKVNNLPRDAGTLVTEDGQEILFGGVAILVDDEIGGSENGGADQVFLGSLSEGLSEPRAFDPVSQIVLMVDSENAYTAGDNSGTVLEVICPYGTQTMANRLLGQLGGYVYRPFSAGNALLDPASELGDAVTVGGVYSVLAYREQRFDGLMTSDIAAPGEQEIESEYPYQTAEMQLNYKIAQTRSLIEKTSEEIRLSVEGLDGKVTALSVTLDGVTIQGASGETLIKGSSIETGSLKLTGAISWGDFDTGTQDIINSINSLAGNAAVAASSASNQVGAWTYPGTTYINGQMLMTGTVMASQLLGGYVGLLNAYQQTVGQISIGLGNEGYAIELISTGGGLRLQSASNFWVSSAYGSMGITASGAIFSVPPIPIGGGMVSLGTSSFLWSAVYAQTGQIVTSDRQKKNTISYDVERYSALFDKLRPVSYKLNTNESNRTHIGFISQDVEQALEEVGISSQDFAGFIKSHRRDEEGNIVEGKYDYALRYEEFIALNTMEIQKLKARVAELEAMVCEV